MLTVEWTHDELLVRRGIAGEVLYRGTNLDDLGHAIYSHVRQVRNGYNMKTKGTIWACDGPNCREKEVTDSARELPPEWLTVGLTIPSQEDGKGRLNFHNRECAAGFFATFGDVPEPANAK